MQDNFDTLFWVERLRAGDQHAAQRLWENYFKRMVVFAQGKLAGWSKPSNDDEDVALSAFKSFCRGVKEGRFPRLDDRDDLWRLLVTITRNKLSHLVRNENRQKRGGNWTKLSQADAFDSSDDIMNNLICEEPTPEMAAQFAEECEILLGKLAEPELVELAVLKLEGYSNSEIAAKWGKAERTVERKLQLIRRIWQAESEVDPMRWTNSALG